jgi:hypothetical protein
LNKHEENYNSFEGEMLAAVWAVKTFRSYVLGLNFTVVTDQSPLQWLVNKPDVIGKHARWALSLQEFTFIITHRSGITHQNADVPSRYPQLSKIDNTGARLDEEHISAVTTSGLWTSLLSRWQCSNEWTVAMAAFNQPEVNQDVEEDPLGLSDEDAERHAKCTRVIHHAIMRIKRKLSSTPTCLIKTMVTKQAVKNKVHCESLCMNPISSSFFRKRPKRVGFI